MTSIKSFSTALRVAGYTTLLMSFVFLGTGCKRKIVTPADAPVTAEDIKDLIARVSGPKKKVGGMIPDTRVAAANRLAQIGAPAKEAIPALEKLAKDKDPEVKKVAEDALAKLKAS